MEVLHLFSSSRALQDFYMESKDSMLGECVLWGEFLGRSCLFPRKKALPLSLRKIILSHAALSVDVSALEFDAQFLEFLEQSAFIFPFLDELASANVKLEDIELRDTYGEYADHLKVLKELQEAYLALLDGLGFYDSVLQKGEFLPSVLNPYDKIVFFIDGFLSPYEKGILEQMATHKPLELCFSIDPYNKPYFDALCGQDFKDFRQYVFDMNQHCILSCVVESSTASVCGYEFDSSLNQAALCIHKVQEWVKEGMSPDKIAIVLPSENFKETLKLFDEHRNFNYAMGESFEGERIYRLLLAISQDEPMELSCDELQRIVEIEQRWRGVDSLLELRKMICKYDADDVLGEVIELFSGVCGLLVRYNLKEMLRLVLLELKQRRVDDVNGGRVRVLGVLETRGIALDGVIVVDMNEGLVPKPNEKDLFLNSAIRQALHLPTRKDRENLQKHYYLSLLRRTQKAAIGWVSDDQSYVSSLVLESQFIPEMNIIHHKGEALYQHSLFGRAREHKIHADRVVAGLPDGFCFSYTKIKAFLECPMRFYYEYLQGLEERQDYGQKGSLIHDLLEQSYRQESTPKAREALFYHLLQNAHEGKSESEIFSLELIARYMRTFFAKEKAYYEKGERVVSLEEDFTCMIEGFKFRGRIDRISEHNGKLLLLDYKLKKNIEQDSKSLGTLMQFVIYQKAMESMGRTNVSAYLYDLYRGRRILCSELEGASEYLMNGLSEIKAHGEMSFEARKNKNCIYCPYGDICAIAYA